MAEDAFHCNDETYPVCSLYYDTNDGALIRRSLEKPVYKEKLRLRAYGTPSTNGLVYIEIKKKFSGAVSKRRCALGLREADAFLAGGVLLSAGPEMNMQVLREAQYMLTRRQLQPTVYICCRRRAYTGTDDPRLRITFDKETLTRRHDLRLEAGMYGTPLLPEGQWIMEIKTPGGMPLWLSHILTREKIYPRSFSKYGAEARRTSANP